MNNEDINNDTKNKKGKSQKKSKKSKNIQVTKFGDLEGKFLLVKVGSSEEPASTEQITNIRDQLVDLFEENNINCLAFVTHHLVSMEIIEKQQGNHLQGENRNGS